MGTILITPSITMNNNKEAELELLIKAKYPIIYLVSWEERRMEEMLSRVASQRHKRLYFWTITEGISEGVAAAQDMVRMMPVDPAAKNPLAALEFVERTRDAALFVLKDFHPFLDVSRSNQDNYVVIRKLRDLARTLKESPKTLIILSPVLRFPAELEKDLTVLDYALPSTDELNQSLERVIRSAKTLSSVRMKLDPETRERVLHAALGLTCSEAENVFAKSLVQAKRFDLEIIIAEKKQLIRKSRVLEYYHSQEDFNYVGGMALLKEWLRKRGLAFSERARQFGLPQPRGLLLLGVQGSGKSLLAKAVARQWHLPLIKLDMGRVFSELVGSSEQNMRNALRTAESVAPCVLWADEIEKGLAGVSSSHRSDAGTTARVMANFLTWMQEKTSPVFVIGTSNDVTLLPPEALRKGRFDEIFFVDLPNYEERREILAIHLLKRRRNPRRYDLDTLAKQCDGFSGAEIEQAIISGLYDAFEAERELTTEDIARNIADSVPLSQTMRERIAALRDWARTRARPASATPVSAVRVETRGDLRWLEE